MNFDPSKEEIVFRERIRALAESYDWPAMQAMRHEIRENDAERFSIEFNRKLAELGLIGLGWPKPWGADASAAQAFLFMEELECMGLPGYGLTQTEAAGNLIMRQGNEKTRAEHIPNITAGKWRYCGGLSEPDAGSDLLALKTTAIRDGDEFVVNGSKLWTSAAHIAHWCSVVARSDPTQLRTKGLSLLLVDMQSPGVTVRPVRVMGGWRVNAVFFDNVRVPAANLIGEEHQGWKVLTGRLDKERAMSFGGTEARLLLSRVLHRIDDTGVMPDEPDLVRIGRFVTDCEADRLLNLTVSLKAGRSDDTSGTAAMSKVFGSELAQQIAQWAADFTRNESLYPDGADPLAADIEEELRAATVLTIIGGTSEIQRNLVAGRSLDLPKSV